MTRLAELLDRTTDRAADAPVVAAAADRISAVLNIPPGRTKDLLSGTPFGHPAHPVLAQASIGLLVGANVLDLLGERRAAGRLIGAGLLAALPTVTAGWSDWADTAGREQRVGIVHSTTNATGIGLYAASWLARRRGGGGALLAAAGGLLMGVGGWLGGHMSYALGVGVDTTAFQEGPSDWTDVGADADLAEGEPVAADAEGVPVLLVRSGGRVHALAARCTHRGAPLSDGTVADGCVTCPWHLSVFDLESGEVVRGPATRPQPRYDVREVGGRLHVKREEDRTLRTNPVGV